MKAKELMQRRKIIYVPLFLVVKFFINMTKDGNFTVEKIKNIPNDVIVRNCFYDVHRDSFAFILLHKSFDIVPAGAEMPIIKAEIEKLQYKEIL